MWTNCRASPVGPAIRRWSYDFRLHPPRGPAERKEPRDGDAGRSLPDAAHARGAALQSARPARHHAPSRSFGTTLPRRPAAVNRPAGRVRRRPQARGRTTPTPVDLPPRGWCRAPVRFRASPPGARPRNRPKEDPWPLPRCASCSEAGVHFGHQTRRWNPKMRRFIFGERAGIYVIDLQKTMRLLEEAHDRVRDIAARGGTVLFVGTKKQARDAVAAQAAARRHAVREPPLAGRPADELPHHVGPHRVPARPAPAVGATASSSCSRRRSGSRG